MTLARTSPPRGSTLLLVIVLLLVLSVIGVAAVRLGAQERVNASAKGKRDYLVACANAARLQLWTEISRSGTAYLQAGTPAAEITLPDGTRLQAPSAPSWSSKGGSPVVDLVEMTPMITAKAAVMGDMTNGMVEPRSLNNSLGYRILARCRDPKDRELYIEFTTKFALN